MRRRIPLGIASDDTYLQSLINFTSTPETQHLGILPSLWPNGLVLCR